MMKTSTKTFGYLIAILVVAMTIPSASSYGQLQQGPSNYGSRIGSELVLLWDHPIDEPDAIHQDRRNFGILLIGDIEKSGRGRKSKGHATAVIEGGHADGLVAGAKGAVYVLKSDGTEVKAAEVEIVEVGTLESRCELAIQRNKTITKYQAVSFELPPLSDEECLSRGLELFGEEDYENALSYLRHLVHLAGSNEIVGSHLTTCRQKYLDKYSSLSEADLAPLRQGVSDNLLIAESFVRLGNRDAAVKYLIMAAVGDSTAEGLGVLSQGIKILESCDLMKRYAAKIDKTVSLDRLPRMTEFKLPISPTEEDFSSSEFSQSITTWYISGSVDVKAHIGPAGELLEVDLWPPNSHEPLNKAALKAAYHSRFQPAIRCGRPVSCWVSWRYEFFIE